MYPELNHFNKSDKNGLNQQTNKENIHVAPELLLISFMVAGEAGLTEEIPPNGSSSSEFSERLSDNKWSQFIH